MSPLAVRQHLLDALDVSICNLLGGPKLTLTLGRLLREDMVQVGLATLVAALAGAAETLRRPALGLELGHFHFSVLARSQALLPVSGGTATSGLCSLFLWCNHHCHLTAFHLWKLLDAAVLFEVITDSLKQLRAQFLVGHLAATEP